MDNFHHSGKYSAEIASHQAELTRKGKFTDQRYLSISSLQTDYLNLDSSSDCGGNSDRKNIVCANCPFCGCSNHSADFFSKWIRKEKEKSRASGYSYNRPTERKPCKCFTCGSEDNITVKFPKPPKDTQETTNTSTL